MSGEGASKSCPNIFLQAYMIDSLYIRVINLHIVIFFTIHWIACLHYLVADLFNPPDDRKPGSWVTRMDLWEAGVDEKYVNSAIRAISNMVIETMSHDKTNFPLMFHSKLM